MKIRVNRHNHKKKKLPGLNTQALIPTFGVEEQENRNERGGVDKLILDWLKGAVRKREKDKRKGSGKRIKTEKACLK